MSELRVPLEDELGDVLEKALRRSGRSEQDVAAAARVPVGKLRDAIDYCYDFQVEELCRLAGELQLNEVGLNALGCGGYPLPEIEELPFGVRPLHMAHGLGVSNAYLVETGSESGAVLFDTGVSPEELARVWPSDVGRVGAVFLTHVEAEHAGGLDEVLRRWPDVPVNSPESLADRLPKLIGEGEQLEIGELQIEVFRTPGHAAAHNCYLVRDRARLAPRALLVAGDLIFAGSAGGGYHCPRQLGEQLRRMLRLVPPDTVIAPGHGPMTTLAHEMHFNPFLV